jgi:hypothetical protein
MTTTQKRAEIWQAVGQWTGGTVPGVTVRRDAQGVAHVLAASRAGPLVWRSDAPHWRLLTRGLSDPAILAVAYAGGRDEGGAETWAATATGRLYRRADADSAWTEVAAWAGLGVGTALAVSPAFDTDATLWVGTPAGIFRTLDAGASWENCDFGLLDNDTLCLACAPNFAESQLVWAGTAGGGLYRSRNGGRAWRESGVGLADAPVQALAVSPAFAQDHTLYAAQEGAGVYRSQDGGASWMPWSDGLDDAQVNTLACVDDTVCAGSNMGVLRRGAGADRWERGAALPEPVLALAADGAGVLVAGMYLDGPAVSTDGGANWTMAHVSLHTPPLVARVSPAVWLAADGDGALALTEDGGATWRNVEPPEATALYGLAGVEGAPGGFWAATSGGLFGWKPGADVWQVTALADRPVVGVDVADRAHDAIGILATTADGGVYLSEDGGATWRDVAGRWRDRQVLRAELDRCAEGAASLHVLAARANEAGHYAVELWESEDGGLSWQSPAELVTAIPAVLTAWPADPAEGACYLATQHRVIKLYRHDGKLAVQQHLFDEQTRVTALAVSQDYATDGVVFAATNEGLACSRDRGATWLRLAELPDGLPLVWLMPEGNSLTAMTLGGAVWRLPSVK